MPEDARARAYRRFREGEKILEEGTEDDMPEFIVAMSESLLNALIHIGDGLHKIGANVGRAGNRERRRR